MLRVRNRGDTQQCTESRGARPNLLFIHSFILIFLSSSPSPSPHPPSSSSSPLPSPSYFPFFSSASSSFLSVVSSSSFYFFISSFALFSSPLFSPYSYPSPSCSIVSISFLSMDEKSAIASSLLRSYRQLFSSLLDILQTCINHRVLCHPMGLFPSDFNFSAFLSVRVLSVKF